jgi:hypothetical protein
MRRALGFSIAGTLLLMLAVIVMNENAKYYRSLYEQVMQPHEVVEGYRVYQDRVEVSPLCE